MLNFIYYAQRYKTSILGRCFKYFIKGSNFQADGNQYFNGYTLTTTAILGYNS